jgi:hypothetical protein
MIRPGNHHAARRRGGGMAARGARAGKAAEDSDFSSSDLDHPPYRNGRGKRMAGVFRRATSLGLR